MDNDRRAEVFDASPPAPLGPKVRQDGRMGAIDLAGS
jgi:hypothetical protein